MRYGATAISKNSKVGPTLVTSTSMDSCWEGCPHHYKRNGSCYALFGPQGLYWRKIGNSIGMSFMQLFYYLRRHIPRHTVWRHNVSGDLPSRRPDNQDIDPRFVKVICKLNKQCQSYGFTYTHKPWRKNIYTLYYAYENGFTINVSTDDMDDAVEAYNRSLPTTVTVAHDTPAQLHHNGVRFVVCPEQTGKMRNCVECKLCYKHDRKYVIMFRAHGPKARSITTGATQHTTP
jgi:hypothetical protein